MRTTLGFLVIAMACCAHARAEVLRKAVTVKGMRVEYRVVLPKGYDPAREYPAVLAFGGGPQDIAGADRSIERNWRDEAERHGYIVIFPAAPGGQLFFEGGERIFPEFLDLMLADYRIRDRRFHIAGISNGGITAFHVAALYPKYFLSITAFPGFLHDPTEQRVRAIAPLCIFMHVGEFDSLGWEPRIEQEAGVLQKIGLKIHFRMEKGQEHRIETLAGKGAARLFDQFEQAEHGCPADAPATDHP
jgi:poly(3-hydroxybutyrate) depolymerase